MMRGVIVTFFGLNTPLSSDGCGLRPMVEALAESTGCDDYYATWDGAGMAYPVEQTISRLRNIGFDPIIAIGHSHGAWRMHKCLLALPPNSVALAVYLDEAPVANPLQHILADEKAEHRVELPLSAMAGRAFYQRKDPIVRGVQLRPRADGNAKSFLVGGHMPRSGYECGDVDLGFNLGHSEMCRDERVHDRIILAARAIFAARQHDEFQRLK
jgi:pimeloyl-ACP methyl ester carboxylesterase